MRAAAFGTALVLAALVLASCTTDSAPKPRRWNPNGVPGGNGDWHSATGMLIKYDANHDGTVTRDELEKGLKADFEVADKHHTGCLDADEVTELNEERMKYDESAASPLIDWKNNPGGCIDFDEYAAMPRSLFEDLDKNGDGKLTPDELHPRHVKPGQPHPVTPSGGGY